jgi:meiosis-specific APC/C activator protein AMA1
MSGCKGANISRIDPYPSQATVFQANERQVSRGTVWTVGGLAPVGNPVDDGRGHMIRSGTHAQVFTTSFSGARPNQQEDLEKYHGRVASALDIDRARRVLDFDGRATLPRAMKPRRKYEGAAPVKTL